MSIFDELPKPIGKLENKPTHPQAKLQFAQILNAFALVYLFLHKFLMPIFVIYTSSLPTRSIEKIDWWWLYHVGLAIVLWQKQSDKMHFRGVLSFGLAGLIVQFSESFVGKSWHSFSLWLTAASTLAVVLYIYKTLQPVPFAKQARYVVVGFVLGLLTEGSLYYFYDRHPYIADLRTPAAVAEAPLLLQSNPNLCGVSEFSLSVREGQIDWPDVAPMQQLQIRDCGLPFPLALLPEHDLLIHNVSTHYLNLKLNYWDGVTWRGYQNIPLPKLMHANVKEEDLQHDVILVTSDSNPKEGVVLLVKSQSSLQEILNSVEPGEKPVLYVIKRDLLQIFPMH